MEKTTGGKIIARMLEAEGVDTLFGIIDDHGKLVGHEPVCPAHDKIAGLRA